MPERLTASTAELRVGHERCVLLTNMRKLIPMLCTVVAGCAVNGGKAHRGAAEGAPTSDSPAVTAPDARESDAGLRLRPPVPGERASLLQLHMADHYADLRLMERAMVKGDLAEVRDYATALVFDRADPQLAPWTANLERMRSAAEALSLAADVPEACRRAPVLAAVCGDCHQETGAQLAFADDGPPVDDGTTPVRMARHQWAADRLWQALVAPSDAAWRDALAVLAATPLPADELGVDATAEVRDRLVARARLLQSTAKAVRPIDGSRRRAEAYGELLRLCASCHAMVR